MNRQTILRVFPVRTSYTPDDDYVRIGEPDIAIPLPETISECHISCTFTWNIEEARRIRWAWSEHLGYLRHILDVNLGGPACDDPGGSFIPGMYVKQGISISSRGCPHSCPWCFVPKREGKLRLLDICPGNEVQDNNITAFPRAYFRALCQMLAKQRRIRLVGGLSAKEFRPWHLEALRGVDRRRFREIWFAADRDVDLRCLKRIRPMLNPLVEGLADNGRRKLRCYVMIGYKEGIRVARRRLENVWDLGFLPFAQLYRDASGEKKGYSPEWRALEREWARPAATYAIHKHKEMK